MGVVEVGQGTVCIGTAWLGMVMHGAAKAADGSTGAFKPLCCSLKENS